VSDGKIFFGVWLPALVLSGKKYRPVHGADENFRESKRFFALRSEQKYHSCYSRLFQLVSRH
jgi:hypothetical protein